ncbi:MAG TPA: hypothetical protein VIL92_00070 [Gaiellaceae bacterium]
MTKQPYLPLRAALRAAQPLAIDEKLIRDCVDPRQGADALFEQARAHGLSTIEPRLRAGHLARVTGEIAESIAEKLLDELGYSLFWQLTTAGARGVDLLYLTPDATVLALEVKGTLRPNAIPRLTPSRLRQMSREWLNDPANPAMADWSLTAEDLYTGVMVVDLALALFRIALSGNFEGYAPITELEQLTSLSWLE